MHNVPVIKRSKFCEYRRGRASHGQQGT